MKSHLTKHFQDLYDCQCNIMTWNDYFIQMLVFRVLARKGKNYMLCVNWEIKCNWGSERTVSPSMGSGGPGGEALEKVTIFSLKLVWYSLLKKIKLKLSVSNKRTT